MARRVFFSFHFDRDHWRANQVRNSNSIIGADDAGFIDDSEWNEVKIKDKNEIARQIRERIARTMVTIVLVGRETHKRYWVDFEIEESINHKNGFLAIYIHHLKHHDQSCDYEWNMPLLPSRLPAGTPTMLWDSTKWSENAAAIEAAGKRAEALRAAVYSPFGLGPEPNPWGFLGLGSTPPPKPKPPDDPESFASLLARLNKKKP
jgi:hypothetical protein